MNPKVIVIDGKTYHSIDEMPTDIRQKYEQAMQSLADSNGNRIPDAFENLNILTDKDKNGVPDVLENLTAGNAVVNSMKIIVDGKEFNGIENLPPEARARYEEAGMETPSRSMPLPASPTITPDTSNGWMLALAGLFIFFLCVAGAAGVWYFFLR